MGSKFVIKGPALAVSTDRIGTVDSDRSADVFTAQLGRGTRWALCAAGPTERMAVERLADFIMARFAGVGCAVAYFGRVIRQTSEERVFAYHLDIGATLSGAANLANLLEAVADDSPEALNRRYGSVGAMLRAADAAARLGQDPNPRRRSVADGRTLRTLGFDA